MTNDRFRAMNPTFFATAGEFRIWLEAHHDRESEVWVGFHKKGSGRPSITWPESVDAALCFGWIDGVRKSLGEFSYVIRFTPRRAGSTWSTVNIQRVSALTEQGLMHPAGLVAFDKRKAEKSGIYAYEQRDQAALGEAFEQLFRANAAAWRYFEAQPPTYRKTAIWWVVSAKQETTRQKRLQQLIEDSAQGRPVPPFRWSSSARRKQPLATDT